MEASLARVPSISIALIFAWAAGLVFSLLTIALFHGYALSNNESSILALLFVVFFFGAPVLIAYEIWVFRFHPIEFSIIREQSEDGRPHFVYSDEKGGSFDRQINEAKILQFNSSTLILKVGRLRSFWLRFYDDETMNQALGLVFPDASIRNPGELEVTARTFYVFDLILFESVLVLLFLASPTPFEKIIYFLIALAYFSVYFLSYFRYCRMYLFRLKGTQVIAEAEEPTFLEKWSGRQRTAISANSIRVNPSKKHIFLVSFVKGFVIAQKSSDVLKWFSETKSASYPIKTAHNRDTAYG